MYLSEIFTVILIKSGQFLIEPDEIELKEDKWVVLVKTVLSVYSNYLPYEAHFQRKPTGSNGNWSITFTEGDQYGIPKGIADATPTETSDLSSSIQSIFGVLPTYNRSLLYNKHLIDKSFYPFEYRSPKLFLSDSGYHDIHAFYKHEVTLDSSNKPKIDTISYDDDEFFELLTAEFLLVLSKQRRAFTIEAIQLKDDSEIVASEAKELKDATMENIVNNKSKIWLSY